MNYITEEQFLEQSGKIQLMLLDWWKPQDNDLISERLLVPKTNDGFYTGDYCRFEADIMLFKDKTSSETETIPLFNESQLRRFIEEKTNKKVWVLHNPDYREGHSIIIQLGNSNDDFKHEHMQFAIITKDLLEAYWQVTCKIAKETN